MRSINEWPSWAATLWTWICLIACGIGLAIGIPLLLIISGALSGIRY